jgi:hypothetical protein
VAAIADIFRKGLQELANAAFARQYVRQPAGEWTLVLGIAVLIEAARELNCVIGRDRWTAIVVVAHEMTRGRVGSRGCAVRVDGLIASAISVAV